MAAIVTARVRATSTNSPNPVIKYPAHSLSPSATPMSWANPIKPITAAVTSVADTINSAMTLAIAKIASLRTVATMASFLRRGVQPRILDQLFELRLQAAKGLGTAGGSVLRSVGFLLGPFSGSVESVYHFVLPG